MNKLILLMVLGILLVTGVYAQIHGSDFITFENTYAGWECHYNKTSSYWLNSSDDKFNIMLNGIMVTSPIAGNCSLGAADITGGCCPVDKPSCWSDGKCYTGGEFCANYNTSQSSCNGANTGTNRVATNSVNNSGSMCNQQATRVEYEISDGVYGPSTCFNYTQCLCAWVSNSCVGRANATTTCSNGSGFEWSNSDGYCTWATPTDAGSLSCDASGVITYTSKATWTGDLTSTSLAKQSCADIVRTYTCPETAKLPFFGWFNLFFSMIFIGMIYYFFKKY